MLQHRVPFNSLLERVASMLEEVAEWVRSFKREESAEPVALTPLLKDWYAEPDDKSEEWWEDFDDLLAGNTEKVEPRDSALRI